MARCPSSTAPSSRPFWLCASRCRFARASRFTCRAGPPSLAYASRLLGGASCGGAQRRVWPVGHFCVVPLAARTVEPLLRAKHWFFCRCFRGPIRFRHAGGRHHLGHHDNAAVSSVSRRSCARCAASAARGAIGLGATRWEVVRVAVLPYAKSARWRGHLGLGRALGETMAITMVIGNRSDSRPRLFAPSYTSEQ